MDIKEVLHQAKINFAGRCRVCPQCNGIACAGEIPGMGGLRSARSFKNNYEAWSKYGIVMQSMAGVREPDMAASFLDMKLDLPVMIAPIGGVPLNMTEAMSEEDYCQAVCIGANKAGTIAWTGDSGTAGIYDAGLAQLEKTNGKMIPTIKPRENAAIIQYAQKAIDMGAKYLACDIDAAVLVNMRLFGQPVETKTMEEWKDVISRVNVPFILKGIMTPKEAILAYEAGAAAIVVSNHGGRILDGMIGTADVLEDISKAVKGKIPIIVDGGIRNGEDVFKAIALGADLVMLGRSMAIAAVGGREEGVEIFLNKIKQELRDAMMMTGCQTLKDINRDLIQKI